MVDATLADLGGLLGASGGQPSQGALWDTLTNRGQWLAPESAADASAAPQLQDRGALWNGLTNYGQWLPPSEPSDAPMARTDAAVSAQPAPQAHGLLGHIAHGLHNIIGGLLGSPAPQPTSAAQTNQDQPQPHEGFASKAGHFLFGGGQGNPNDPLGRYRPGFVQEALGTVLSGGNPWLARDVLTERNINQANMARQQQIVQALAAKDPAEAQAFLMDPKGWLDAHYGASVLKPGEVKYIGNKAVAGAPADVAPEHTLASPVTGGTVFSAPASIQKLGPSDTGWNPNTGFTFTAPAGIQKLGPSETGWNPNTGQSYTAPAKPEVVTYENGKTREIITPDELNPSSPGQPQPAPGNPAPNPGGASRGIRNNNPWNVTPLSKGQWAGQTGTDGDFAQFSTPQAGARAADLNLKNYAQRDGVNTIRGVISRWAPKWQTETPTYVQAVSDATGFKPDQPLDIATNSQTRAKILHAMLPIEAGRTGASQAQASGVDNPGGASTAPSPTGAPNAPNIRQGAMPRDVPAQEAIAKGLAPGKWQQLPDGSYKQVSQPPKDDLDKVAHLRGATKVMDELAGSDARFMDAASRTRPSPWLAGGEHILQNPYAWYMEHNNPDVSQMESLHNQEIFQMKPDNAGQRIMATEIPIWGSSTVDPSKSLEANQGIVRDHQEARDYMDKKAEFYENWLYTNGTLHGADQAWGKVAPQHRAASVATGSAPQRQAVNLPPRAPALPPSGFRFVQ